MAENDAPKLKPCPWCKAIPQIDEEDGYADIAHSSTCFIRLFVKGIAPREFEQWNTRADLFAPDAAQGPIVKMVHADPDHVLPCPFCGALEIAAYYDDGLYWRRCQSCGATGPETTKYSGAEGEPFTDWNSRTAARTPTGILVRFNCNHEVVEGRKIEGCPNCYPTAASTEAQHTKELLNSGTAESKSTKTYKEENDFFERAQQLVNKYASDEVCRVGSALTNDIASFAAEAATQGQVVGIERAAKVVEVCTCGSGPEFRAVHMRYHAVTCNVHTATMIRALSPDPSYLDRVRNEAATAALEQAAQVVKDRRSWYGEEFFGPMPSMEDATESEKRLVTLASANMARHTCDHLLTEIAAIGDDKEE